MYNYNPYMMPQFNNNRQQIVRVNGMGGAQAFQMMPNSSALLLDENQPLLYLAQTDGAGYKTVTTFKIEAYTPEPEIDLEARIKKLEEMVYHGNHKPDTSDVSETGAKPSTASAEHAQSGQPAGTVQQYGGHQSTI